MCWQNAASSTYFWTNSALHKMFTVGIVGRAILARRGRGPSGMLKSGCWNDRRRWVMCGMQGITIEADFVGPDTSASQHAWAR